jgi:hypothetical protein
VPPRLFSWALAAPMARVLLAFLVSPLVATIFVPWAIEGKIILHVDLLVIVIFVAPFVYFYTAITALPTYLLLRKLKLVSKISLAFAAFLCGVLSFLYFDVSLGVTNSSINDVALKVGGEYTPAGWVNLLRQCSIMGAGSAIAGLVFWQIAHGKMSEDSSC